MLGIKSMITKFSPGVSFLPVPQRPPQRRLWATVIRLNGAITGDIRGSPGDLSAVRGRTARHAAIDYYDPAKKLAQAG